MNDCKTCKNWQPIRWIRPAEGGGEPAVAHHTGKCPVLFSILDTDGGTTMETPAVFSCKFWAAK